MNKLGFVEKIYIHMSEQRNLKEIRIGKKGKNLGYPLVAITDLSLAKYLHLRDVKRSFSSICKVVNTANQEDYTCNYVET